MFVMLVMPTTCHAMKTAGFLHAESVQGEIHRACVSAPDGCVDDRDPDLSVVEVAAAAFDFSLPEIVAFLPPNALPPTAGALHRARDRRALPSLALYERTLRLRN